jgi:hypothetical protein
MLRVLKPGGQIAFSTWPPELFTGRMFALVARYAPPPPPGVASPPRWGEPGVVRERLGGAVKDLVFDRARTNVPCLSPAHHRQLLERAAGPVTRLVERLSKEAPSRLESFRRDYEELALQYGENNAVRQDFLMSRATKI